MADRAFLERLSRELTDQGKLIEAGWVSFRLMVVPDEAGPKQLESMRWAFMAGAQHLFGSVMTILDPGTEPTDGDLERMSQIAAELDKFIEEVKLLMARPKGST